MRLPVVISAILVAFIGINTPVISQPPIQVAQTPAFSNFNLRNFISNNRLWRRQSILNYRYTFTRSCNCLPKVTEPVIIEVRNGITTSITVAATGVPADRELFQKYNTIPKLFDVIRNAIARRAANLTVEYNRQFHYPTQINID